MITEFLIRHGESHGNADPSKYFEMMDCHIDLTEKGKQQAKDVASTIRKLSNWQWFDVFYSPYARTTNTKNILASELTEHAYGEVNSERSDPRMIEREWGQLRNILRSKKITPEHWNFFYRPSEGESFCDCYGRAASFGNWLDNNHTNHKNPRILVSHGEWIKTYLMYRLGWTLEQFYAHKNPQNCQVIMLTCEDGTWRISPETPLKIVTYC